MRNGIYLKKVIRSKHLMRMFMAYGIDKDVFDILEGECTEIRIKETDTGNYFRIPYKLWKDNQIIKDFDGKQSFFPLRKLSEAVKEKELVAKQMKLI
jgi:hypothetical protein